MQTDSPRDAGYTLLEMLGALVVFGLVMAGIAQSFRFGLTAWTAGTRTITKPENMAALDAALTRLINQALPGSLTGLPNGMDLPPPCRQARACRTVWPMWPSSPPPMARS